MKISLLFFYRFWYGGSEGNDNRFDDKKICDETCVDPIGREACELPRVSGPCDGHFPRYLILDIIPGCK